GEGEEGRGGHQARPLRAMAGKELLQTIGQGVARRIVDIEEGAEEVVPGREELKEGAGRQGRFGERQNDLPEDTPLARAVHPRRLAQILRQGAVELRQQEDIEGRAEEGRDRQW